MNFLQLKISHEYEGYFSKAVETFSEELLRALETSSQPWYERTKQFLRENIKADSLVNYEKHLDKKLSNMDREFNEETKRKKKFLEMAEDSTSDDTSQIWKLVFEHSFELEINLEKV
ncbi:uncharacterized protein LOC143446545 [Clavelina lepadiformis]|uniref:uncharacterized protein LOC143446545 n=1 Tax=Clavelina lepadiformis TaxID=159417 RepID=UPI004042CD4A